VGNGETDPAERILESVADALIFADGSGTIRRWNRASAALFGFSAEEALGQKLDLIIPEHLRAAHWARLRRGDGVRRAQARGPSDPDPGSSQGRTQALRRADLRARRRPGRSGRRGGDGAGRHRANRTGASAGEIHVSCVIAGNDSVGHLARASFTV